MSFGFLAHVNQFSMRLRFMQKFRGGEPVIQNYISTAQELRARTADLFAHYAAGRLQVAIDREFPLSNAADSHRYLEQRNTKGKLLLKIS